LTVATFVGVGVVGLFVTRGWVQRLHKMDHRHEDRTVHSHNDIVGFYLAGMAVFFAVTLGLLAIGAWSSYTEVQEKINREATALGALYRDVGAYPEPARTIMQDDLRRYTRAVIDVGWPMQQHGVVPNNANGILNDFQEHFMSFEPETERQKIIAEEAYRAFNALTESRRERLNSVTVEMPGPLWALVVFGTLICIALTWFFHMANFTMHMWMTILFSALLGLIIFLIAVLDNPYRGKVSVTPEPLERVYQQLMVPGGQ
jgi:Protein of unknown function (DUF4239)